MPLDSTKCADRWRAAIERQAARKPSEWLSPASMAAELAGIYNDYAKEATLLGADMTAGGAVDLLEAAFAADGTPAAVAVMAAGICNFWGSFVTIGTPAHGGTAVASVLVGGASQIAAMSAAITGLIGATEKPTPYLDLIKAVEDVVKLMPCIITEIMPPNATPTPFPEFIS